jgi:hypothetical protein
MPVWGCSTTAAAEVLLVPVSRASEHWPEHKMATQYRATTDAKHDGKNGNDDM